MSWVIFQITTFRTAKTAEKEIAWRAMGEQSSKCFLLSCFDFLLNKVLHKLLPANKKMIM